MPKCFEIMVLSWYHFFNFPFFPPALSYEEYDFIFSSNGQYEFNTLGGRGSLSSKLFKTCDLSVKANMFIIISWNFVFCRDVDLGNSFFQVHILQSKKNFQTGRGCSSFQGKTWYIINDASSDSVLFFQSVPPFYHFLKITI